MKFLSIAVPLRIINNERGEIEMQKKRSDIIMLIVLLGYFIILVDTSLVFTCSNEIGNSFKMNTQMASWISNAYALTFGSLLLLGGRLGDIFGRKQIFIIGLIIFGVSSLSVGLAPTGILLIIFRAIQGIGAAIIAPATLAIIMDNYTGPQQSHEIAVYGMMSGVGVSIGLLLGAGITTIASWRWGFLINVPLSLLLIVLTIKYIPVTQHQPAKIDWIGTILSFIAVVLIINGINGIGPKIISLVVGIILLALFIFYENRIQSPILPLVIFKSWTRNTAFLIRFIYTGAINSFWFFTPRILQTNYHLTPILVGLSFLPMTIVNFYSAEKVDILARKYGNLAVMTCGIGTTIFGFGWLIFLRPESNYWLMVALPMILIGFGQGLVLSPVTNLGVSGLASNVAGVGSSMINIMLQLGGVTALAILFVVSAPYSTLPAFHVQAIGIVLFAIVSFLISIGALRKVK